MERMAGFSVIARDGGNMVLLLRGYMNLKSPVTRDYVKKILGKRSNCKMAAGGDVVNLLRYFNIDKGVTVTGELPCTGKRSTGRKKDDANWVLKMARDLSDDFRLKYEIGSEGDYVGLKSGAIGPPSSQR